VSVIPVPTQDQAQQFAVMLHVGLPPTQAILYFLPDELGSDAEIVAKARQLWLQSPRVQAEYEKQIGGKWESMTLDQRIRVSLDKHYSEKAYFLFAHNFSELSGADLSKAQEARKVLEAKQAGTSGKLDPLAQFWDDLKTNKVKLGNQPVTLPA
jgi:hypothetical protein